jgi:hypothetical protein
VHEEEWTVLTLTTDRRGDDGEGHAQLLNRVDLDHRPAIF